MAQDNIDFDFYNQVIGRYSEFWMKLQDEYLPQTVKDEKDLPYPKEIIKEAIFYNLKNFKRNLDMLKNLPSTTKETLESFTQGFRALQTGYANLFVFQHKDFLKEIRENKELYKKEIDKLVKAHILEFKNATGMDFNKETEAWLKVCTASWWATL